MFSHNNKHTLSLFVLLYNTRLALKTKPGLRNGTLRNGTLRNGTLRNGTLRNGTLRNIGRERQRR